MLKRETDLYGLPLLKQLCLFRKSERTLQRYDTVKYRSTFFRIMNICTVESVSYKLETVIAFCFHKSRLNISSDSCKRVWIYVQRTIFFVVYTFFFVYNVFVKTYSCFFGICSFYPVNRSFYFTSVQSVSAFCCRIISTMYNSYCTVIICFISCTVTK